MEITTRKLLVYTLAMCLFSSVLTAGIMLPEGWLIGHITPKWSANGNYDFQIDEGGRVVDYTGTFGNLITDGGTQFSSNLSVGRTMNNYAYGTNGTIYISLGNGTDLAYADTQLTTEITSSDTGFKRSSALTPTYATNTGIGNGYHFNFTVTVKFTATVTNTINATGLHWSGVAGSNYNLFAEASIGTLPVGQLFNSATNDNCTITWTITYQK